MSAPDGKYVIVQIVSKSRNAFQFKDFWGLSDGKYNDKSGANSAGSQSSYFPARDTTASDITLSQENSDVNTNIRECAEVDTE